jgi:hypothetical protein
MKKSLSDFILLFISNLYAELANVIHAISAQISIQNHNLKNKLQSIKHRQIENKNRNSLDFAIKSVSFGIIYLLSTYIHIHIPIILASKIPITSNHHWLHILFMAQSAVNNSITIIS